ncbi:MAG TPA: amidophosphoribosyltransferase [Acidisarcina sp.]
MTNLIMEGLPGTESGGLPENRVPHTWRSSFAPRVGSPNSLLAQDDKLREECRVPHTWRGTIATCVGSDDPNKPDPVYDKLREECGVVAIHGHPDAARQAYLGLYALQHRGQESAGIATADYTHLSNIKGMGLVADIFTDEVIAKLPGELAIGHTRYSTTGDSALLNAQPIRVDSTKGLIAIAHNGNLVNLGNVRLKLERAGAFFQTTSDSEIIVQLIAHSKENTLVDAIADSLGQVEGAFSIVMMTRDRIFAARDPRGFRPLSMGRISNPGGPDTIVFASETCAFDLLHAKYERDVAPGELVMVTRDGVTSRQYATGVPQASCIFEHVYFSRPDSKVFNRWVQDSREEMGRQLARESAVPADLVVPVPDSGVTAAIGYAAESGLPFRFGLIRNHYVGRTFIEPEQRVRDFGVRLKLNPVRNLLEGKRIVLIDDSIIRGTTSRKIVRMVRAAGATEVHFRVSCPPTISPCFYGVDTPSKRELIAANQSVEEIRQFIEADSLAYLSLDGLEQACNGGEGNHYCTACYTGIYPTQWVDAEDILPAVAAH